MNSAACAAAVNETRALGGATSALRTPEQLEVARFHTEPPPSAITRNPGRFASSIAHVGEALRGFYGTPQVTFTWDSTATRTTRTCVGVGAFNAEAGLARLHGGMHFRPATVAGEELGRRVAQWVQWRAREARRAAAERTGP